MNLICSAGKNLPHLCGNGFFERDGKILCGAHYWAKYALDFGDQKQYKVNVMQFMASKGK